jgi:hypothetical protein
MVAEFLLSFRYASSTEGCSLLVGKRDVKKVIQLCLHETVVVLEKYCYLAAG